MTRQTTGPLRDLLLDASVGDKGVDTLLHQSLIEVGAHLLRRNGCSHRHRMSLTERAGAILYPSRDIQLRVTRRRTAPLTEGHQLLHREEALHRQHAVEHRGEVTGVEEKAIPGNPRRVLRIVPEILGEEHSGEVGAAHGSSGVTGGCPLHHGESKDPDIISDHVA